MGECALGRSAHHDETRAGAGGGRGAEGHMPAAGDRAGTRAPPPLGGGQCSEVKGLAACLPTQALKFAL